MNDYYIMLCDLESEEKEQQELDLFDTWVDYNFEEFYDPSFDKKPTVNPPRINDYDEF